MVIVVAATLTDVVPYIGAVVGAPPAVALGLLHTPCTARYGFCGHSPAGRYAPRGPKVVGEAVAGIR